MKMVIGFFIGIAFCLLFLFGMNYYSSKVSADNSAAASTDTLNVSNLLPDVKKIYHEALAVPYQQVESEITDPDIARFFRTYMDRTGLDKTGDEQ